MKHAHPNIVPFPSHSCGSSRFSQRFILGLAVLAAALSSARGGTAYDAQQIVVPEKTNQIETFSTLNRDGALEYDYYDDTRGLYSIGIWTPSPLYGMSAGYHELYTYAGTPINTALFAAIDNSGNVSYMNDAVKRGGQQGVEIPDSAALTFGGANGGSSVSWSGAFAWNDFTTNTSVWSQTIIAQRCGGSDPAPYACGWGEFSKRENISDQTSDVIYPATFNGGVQSLSPPGGVFGEPVTFTRLGYSLWRVYGQDPNLSVPSPDQLSERMVAVIPGGNFNVPGAATEINGDGDVVYFRTSNGLENGGSFVDYEIFLSAPLAGLAPGNHLQSEIPGMPVNYNITEFNSSNAFLIQSQSFPVTRELLVRGQVSPFSEVLPAVVLGSPALTVFDLNETGLMYAWPYTISPNGLSTVYTGKYLLTPTLDCSVALSVTSPIHVGTQFDVMVTVSNLTSANITGLIMQGDSGAPGLTQSGVPTFQILSGPTPAGPVTIGAGATNVFLYHCQAIRPGSGTVMARIRAISPTGNPLRGYSDTTLQVIQLADLQIKESDEADTNFAIAGVYQTVPIGAQSRKLALASDDEVGEYDVKVVNNEAISLALQLTSQQSGTANIPVQYTVNGVDISSNFNTSQGWTSPTLPPGGSLIMTVDFGPSPAATNSDSRTVAIFVASTNGGPTLDAVQAQAIKAADISVKLGGPSTASLDPSSIEAGKSYIDSGLVFAKDLASLAQSPLVNRGLVADGVTPLLFEMTVPADQFAGLTGGISYTVTVELVDGGSLAGNPVASRLLVLHNGAWTADNHLTFTAAANTLYAYLTAVDPDDIQFSGSVKELQLKLHFTHTSDGTDAGEKTFYLRKPPIALVHGYNTAGEWGDNFKTILSSSRPKTDSGGSEDFIRTIHYGQDPPDAGLGSKENSVLGFGPLAAELLQQFKTTMGPLTNDWAFTRFDVVAHSQGGVLSRILCSINPNQWVSLPYRNPENFYRGRFHRVVTVGSPHNGTRILLYMLDLANRANVPFHYSDLGRPTVISQFFVLQGTAQDKFDPFGPSILSINNPNSTGSWYPDQGAKFHLIQTSVNSGNPPNPASHSPADSAIGLDRVGSVVLPHGSDGVVDLDSQGGYASEANQSPPANVFRMPASQQIAHALTPFDAAQFTLSVGGCTSLFCGDSGQTDSETVAQHAIYALDQSSAIPGTDEIFGPFHLPSRLPDFISDQIAAAAKQVDIDSGPSILTTLSHITGLGSGSGPKPADLASSAYTFQPDGVTITGPVTWFAERFGVGGVTTNGIELDANPADPNGVIVKVDDTQLGDVVLYASGVDNKGQLHLASPLLISSLDPDTNSYSLYAFEARPVSGTFAVGDAFHPEIWETYHCTANGCTNQIVMQRWLDPQVASNEVADFNGHVDVSDPLYWKFTSVGTDFVLIFGTKGIAVSFYTIIDPNATGLDTDQDGIADATENNVPGRNGMPQGDGNGDGVQDSVEPAVVSLLTPADQWLTLDYFTESASTNVQFNVHVVPPPAPISLLPQAYAFDQGFLNLNLNISNIVGVSAVFQVFYPTNQTVDAIWAFGPTPDDNNPHWYDFDFDGTNGVEIQNDRLIVHVTDGGPGDADGMADGVITGLTFGMARVIPGPPSLQIAPMAQGGLAVTWPTSFPNSAHTFLEYIDGLGGTNQWQFVPDVPLPSTGQNVLMDSSGNSQRFFRLHGQ